MRWILLLHQIPPRPAYFRAKVSRRLAQVGALAIKNSAYLLPESDETREDFEWICREIRAEGGAAWLFRAEALAGLSEAQARAAFISLRDADYQELLATAAELDDAKLAHRFEELRKIDFFGHPAQDEVAAILAGRKQRAERRSGETGYSSGTWVTRKGIKVDRIGSAWIIRRFIDAEAKFHFIDPADYTHSKGEIRFDMYEGEFTHEGDLCTFEVLAARHGLATTHPAIQPIAEMVHDIDLKDNRYSRPETVGLSRMLDGLCSREPDDNVRLEKGFSIFDALYESYRA